MNKQKPEEEKKTGKNQPYAPSDVPEHVPSELVRTLDLYEGPGMRVDPFAEMSKLHDGQRIFWTDYSPRYGHGSWVVTHAEDLEYVLNTTELFSSAGWSQTQAITGATWPLVPIELDGEYHRKFRTLMMPWFAGPGLRQLEETIRLRAMKLIDAIRDKDSCEFISEFGRLFPVSIFLDLMGFPQEDMDTFSGWAYNLLHNMDTEARIDAAKTIIKYLEDSAHDRRLSPRDDLVTRIVKAEIDGRPITDDEVIGMLFTLFLGGLDTVVASLGLHFHHLAIDHTLQNQLRADPGLIPKAVEEFLRLYSPVTSRRQATQDTEIADVKIKAGDWITTSSSLGSLDPRRFENPRDFNLNRENKRHFAFSTGPHFCIGMQLARRELVTAIEEWMQRVPTFSLAEKDDIDVRAGSVFAIDRLPLKW